VKVAFDGFQKRTTLQQKGSRTVFAQRPVIVFGKYKCTPAGKVHASRGVVGSRPVRDS